MKGLALTIALIVIVGLIFYLESQKVAPGLFEDGDQPIEVKEGKYPRAPELTGLVGYLNGAEEGIQISDYRGKVVLIDFWTYTCINCIRTLPFLNDWQSKYADKGLVIIGVHTPEFEFEKKKENVEDAIAKHGVEYLVVQDNDYRTWRAFNNRFWPRKYLIDKEGFIRYDHIGEGAYEETELIIQQLLSEIGPEIVEETSQIEEQTPTQVLTPELYAGYGFALPRNQNIGNEEGFQVDQVITYTLPENIRKDIMYVSGTWKNNPDNLEAVSDGSIVLNFLANSVNIVVDPLQDDVTMTVFVDDEEISTIAVDEARLYNIVDGSYGRYSLRLEVSEGFSFNAFTFG